MTTVEGERPILVVGTANIDMSLHVPHLPKSGETVLGDLAISCGGKAANQAVGAARLEATVSLFTRVGDDDHGQTLLAALRQEGVDAGSVTIIPGGFSGVALIMVDRDANTTIGVAEGVNRHMQVSELDGVPQLHERHAIVLAEMGIPVQVIRHLTRLQARVGFTFILNPAPAEAPLDDDLWRGIDVITPNATEAEVLTGMKVFDDESALHAAERLRTLGSRFAIVTLGQRGVAYASAQATGLSPAYKVLPVDTTAASDAFNAGVAVALARGRSHVDAVDYGQAVAALSVTRVGAQDSMPTRAEVAAFLHTHRNAEEPE